MRNLLTRNCIICNKKVTQTYNQSKKDFLSRKYCSEICAGTDENHRKIISARLKGRPKAQNGYSFPKGCKINLGRRQSLEERLMRSQRYPKADNHWNWKGGVNLINDSLRKSISFKLWREEIFKRDDFTCQKCNKRGIKIHAHHIKPFSLYPELRFVSDNGMTLCVECHKDTDSFGGKLFKNYITDSSS